MVPSPGFTARQRCDFLAEQNALGGGPVVGAASHVPKRALVTYSPKDRPLPLTGQQFVRKDTYDFSSDDEGNNVVDHAGRVTRVNGCEASDSSLLSDAHSNQESQIDYSTTRNSTTRVTKSTKGKQMATEARSTKTPKDVVTEPRNGIGTPKVSRRLPAGELFCVVPSLDCDYASPVGSLARIDVKEPIADSTTAPSVNPSQVNVTVSGTVIRKRLRTPKLRTKTLVRKRRDGHVLPGFESPDLAVGDGFDKSELVVAYRLRTPRQSRKSPSSTTYSALPMRSGPLPEVVFECRTDELKLKPSDALANPTPAQQSRAESTAPFSPSIPRSNRKVSFSIKTQLVRAQLSSVRACRRPTLSESEDEVSEVAESESHLANEDAASEDLRNEDDGRNNELNPTRQITEVAHASLDS
ncbi:hypothetical protein LTR62_000963 [Meristemomyces frigidus]|uniref:Uncharacterized protein n=1 Tax=Meristemomyces frigidus TaxID=1508187 RepID=A0AAN7YMN6_9PEZI|nr:hypothetical protein LTR62_000963 [Meristemomyces frigidus]